jgi:hypothetical protein
MSEKRHKAIKAAIFDLENMKDAAELMKLTVADK